MDQHQTSLPTTALAMFLAAKSLLYQNIRSNTAPVQQTLASFAPLPVRQRWRSMVMMSILRKEKRVNFWLPTPYPTPTRPDP